MLLATTGQFYNSLPLRLLKNGWKLLAQNVIIHQRREGLCFEGGIMGAKSLDMGSEELLRQYQHQLEILSRVNQQINEQRDIESIMRSLVVAALELTGASDGAAGVLKNGQMVFSEYYAKGQWIPIDFSFPPGYGVPGWVLEHQKSYVSNHPETDPHVIQDIREQIGFYNLVDTPILDRSGKLIGCFEIHNTENHRPFGDLDIMMLQGLSASAAVAMENAQMIAELRTSEALLRENRTYFRKLFEDSPVSLWEEDFSAIKKLLDRLKRKGVDDLDSYLKERPEIVAKCAGLAKVTNINRATLDLFEAKDKATLLGNLDRIMTGESFEDFRQELVSMASGVKQSQVNGVNRTFGGKEIEVCVKWSILPGYEDNWKKIVVSMIDVTHEREIDRLKSEFISTAAHELRTPLSILMGYSELLLQDKEQLFSPEAKREYLEYIYEKGVALERLIDDLLDVAKIETGRALLLEKTSFRFVPLLEEVCRNHQRETSKHSIQLKYSVPELIVIMDRGRIIQVLDNLLNNAVKYSPGGGDIQVRVELVAQRLVVSVIDQGIGLTEQQCKRIFDKFYRVDSSNTALRGLGLGLSICKNIVEAHGGDIWAESTPQEGTTVSFSFPLESTVMTTELNT